jgi:hypothetical protein
VHKLCIAEKQKSPHICEGLHLLGGEYRSSYAATEKHVLQMQKFGSRAFQAARLRIKNRSSKLGGFLKFLIAQNFCA